MAGRRELALQVVSTRWPRLRSSRSILLTRTLLALYTDESGDLGQALHRVVVRREQVGHLLIEPSVVVLDHAQLFERELQQPTIDRMQRRACLEGIARLFRGYG